MTKLTSIVKASVISSIAMGGLLIATPIFAATSDTDQVPHAVVSAMTSDFSSPVAVKDLQRKARQVAAQICDYDGSTANLSSSERACYQTAVDKADAQIETQRQLALNSSNGTQLASQPAQSSVHTAR